MGKLNIGDEVMESRPSRPEPIDSGEANESLEIDSLVLTLIFTLIAVVSAFIIFMPFLKDGQ